MGAVARTEASKEYDHNAADWQRNWHRVASTHTIQDLLTVDHAPDRAAPMCFKSVLLGFGCVAAGAVLMVVLPVCLLNDHFNLGVMVPMCAALCLREVCYGPLLLMTLPTALTAITLHWLLSKLFKHNY